MVRGGRGFGGWGSVMYIGIGLVALTYIAEGGRGGERGVEGVRGG